MFKKYFPIFALFACVCAGATGGCGNIEAPIDADTRHRIDSTTTAETKRIGAEIDSLCQQARTTELPRLIDSIKAVRKREIEEKLKNLPQ